MAAKISLARLPLIAAVVILGVATICAAAVRFTERLPVNPWEAATAVEAMRFNAGLPLYESGHATHMYGPLSTVLLAGIFRVTGFNLLAARILSSILAFALAIFLATIFCRDKLRGYWLLGLLLFLGINFRTNLMFLSAQPDCLAILVAIGGLYFWATAKSYADVAISIPLFLGAVLLKQTTAAFALIPIVHILMWKRPLRAREIALSMLPLMSILLGLIAVRLFWPHVFSAIITIPASIKVYYTRSVGMLVYLLVTFPIFAIALIAAFSSPQPRRDSERWIYSGLAVLVPASIWMVCKSGGSYNSLLFAYLAMVALFVTQLDAIANWLASLSIQRSLAATSALALVILLSFFVQFGQTGSLLFTRCGDDKYDTAVAIARRLGGSVISPQDPTIAYRANGYFGRALYFELDAHPVDGNWPSRLPNAIEEEVEHADYVIEVRTHVPTAVLNHALFDAKFHPKSVAELEGSAYTLWAKARD